MGIEIPAEPLALLRELETAGFDAYLVGGCVRDSLLGKTPADWDIGTSALPEQVAACFSHHPGHRVIETGIQHGTVTVVAEHTPYEVTTFRRDGEYLDHRRPDEVTFVRSLKEDLARRDFTVNALAYHPDKGLIDYFGGVEHIREKRIVAVGEPRCRFQEDALRILRAVRFAAVLGFEIEENTRQAMHAEATTLAHIARERIRAELDKALLGEGVEAAFLADVPVLTQVLPELAPCVGFDQKTPYHNLDIWRHTMRAVGLGDRDLPVRWALLLHDIGKPETFTVDREGVGHFCGHPALGAKMARSALERLRCDKATLVTVETLIQHHDAAVTADSKSVKRWLNRLGEETFRRLLSVKMADRAAHAEPYASKDIDEIRQVRAQLEKVLEEKACYRVEDLQINGRDLLRLGIPEGAEIGVILQKLLELVLEEKLPNQRSSLLEAVQSVREKK